MICVALVGHVNSTFICGGFRVMLNGNSFKFALFGLHCYSMLYCSQIAIILTSYCTGIAF